MVCKETYSCKKHGWLFLDEFADNRCIHCGSEVAVGRVEKMSKSKKNVVDPDALIKKYGADTARLFSLFAAPPEKDLEWSEQGVEGCFRFINRVYRLFINNIDLFTEKLEEKGEETDVSKDILYYLHSTIKKVTNDIEKFQLNTAVAAIMEFTNNLYLLEPQLSTNYEKFLFKTSLLELLKLLTPFTPHFCEEMWSLSNNSGFISLEKWPKYEEKYTIKDEINVVVQINGKVRAELTLPRKIDKDSALKAAKENEKVAKYLEGKNLIKEIYVPQKLISLVIKDN
jgi:leucyl-tRNA synthetase